MLERRWIILLAVGIPLLVVAVIVTAVCVVLLTPVSYTNNKFYLHHYNDSQCMQALANWMDLQSPYTDGDCPFNPIADYFAQLIRINSKQVRFDTDCVGPPQSGIGQCDACILQDILTIDACSSTMAPGGGYIYLTVSTT